MRWQGVFRAGVVACWLSVAACGDDGGDDDGTGEAGRSGQSGASGSSGTGAGAGNGSVPPLGEGIGDPEATAASWTVFVYGHADHNLSNSFVRDVLEMAEAEVAGDVRVVVLADFDASQTIGGSDETFPTGVQWLRIDGGGQEPQTVGEEDELNLDDPDVLAGAIAAAYREFPARRRALILWNHGGAWMGGFGGDSQDGTTQGTPILVPAMAEAIRVGLDAAGVEGPLDILSFDTCLMGSAEVALEMQALTRVYIANAELDYGDGWDYTAFLSYLSRNQDAPLAAIAQAEVEQWDAHHVTASPNDTLLRSHLALDATQLPALAEAIDDFVVAWASSETLSGIELGRASYFSLPPYMNQLEDLGAVPELRDLGQFLSKMAGVSDVVVARAAATARAALVRASLGLSQGELRDAADQLGMHVELPLAAGLSNELLARYEEHAPAWAMQSRWPDALAIYASLDDGVAPTVETTISNSQSPDAASLPTLGFATSDDDVAEAEVNLGVVEPSLPDELILFGLIAKGAVDAGLSYEVAWDGQIVTLPDGEGGVQPIFVRTWEDVDSDAGAMSLPPVLATFGVVATSDGQEALGALLFQDGDDEARLLALLDPPVTLLLQDVARDLPGTTFTPVLATVSLTDGAENAVTGAPIALVADSLPLTRSPAAAGTYALIATVSDVFGNVGGDAEVVELAVPIQ